jgi:hypothetical protein
VGTGTGSCRSSCGHVSLPSDLGLQRCLHHLPLPTSLAGALPMHMAHDSHPLYRTPAKRGSGQKARARKSASIERRHPSNGTVRVVRYLVYADCGFHMALRLNVISLDMRRGVVAAQTCRRRRLRCTAVLPMQQERERVQSQKQSLFPADLHIGSAPPFGCPSNPPINTSLRTGWRRRSDGHWVYIPYPSCYCSPLIHDLYCEHTLPLSRYLDLNSTSKTR